jgi:hypothetical protein
MTSRDVKPLRSETVANGYCIDNLKINLTLGVPKLGVKRKRREKGRRERDRKTERESDRERKGLVGCPANPVAFATKVHSSYNQPPFPPKHLAPSLYPLLTFRSWLVLRPYRPYVAPPQLIELRYFAKRLCYGFAHVLLAAVIEHCRIALPAPHVLDCEVWDACHKQIRCTTCSQRVR